MLKPHHTIRQSIIFHHTQWPVPARQQQKNHDESILEPCVCIRSSSTPPSHLLDEREGWSRSIQFVQDPPRSFWYLPRPPFYRHYCCTHHSRTNAQLTATCTRYGYDTWLFELSSKQESKPASQLVGQPASASASASPHALKTLKNKLTLTLSHTIYILTDRSRVRTKNTKTHKPTNQTRHVLLLHLFPSIR